MPKATFHPSRTTIDVPSGTLVSDAARLAGVMVELPCGGKGTCGKCLVRIEEGAVERKSGLPLAADTTVEGHVLACQTSIAGDVTLTVPEQPSCMLVDDGIDPVLEHGPAIESPSPISSQVSLRVSGAAKEDGLADLDRLDAGLKSALRANRIRYPLGVLRCLAEALRAEDGLVTVTSGMEGDIAHVLDIRPGDGPWPHLGLAVDLGTTTISLCLFDLHSARVLCTRNGYNSQIHCGLDVISRINYASTPERLEDLRLHAMNSINRLILEAAGEAGVCTEDIHSCRISGNTVMTHLLLGLKPEYIRLDPYTPTMLHPGPFMASEVGLKAHPQAPVTFSPCVGSYVGGDITAGVLATGLAGPSKEISLFIDIGTNGEIVVGNSEFLMTCACSAGPAFEGGGIDCGMRATTGAIDSVDVEPDTGHAIFRVIGGGKPAGICGSGLIDLVAGLFLSGWLDASGKLDRTRPSPWIRIEGRRAYYTVAGEKDTLTGRSVIVTENDIDNLMRAKAAIYSAASLLLGQIGIAFNDLATFVIAGGFGRSVNLENAIAIGLLPEVPLEKFHYIGNASLMGSGLCLVSEDSRRTQDMLAKRMTYIDLSTFSGYMHEYTAALFLPHTDGKRFPDVMKILESKKRS